MASGLTLKWAARRGVVKRVGCVKCRWRMPERVSGERRLRGVQGASACLAARAAFWMAHAGRAGGKASGEEEGFELVGLKGARGDFGVEGV